MSLLKGMAYVYGLCTDADVRLWLIAFSEYVDHSPQTQCAGFGRTFHSI